jgi:hypothetical protein
MRRAQRLLTTGVVILGMLASGLVFGVVTVFAAGAPETPLSGPSVGTLTSSSAILEGELNPGSASGEVGWYFTYGTEGSCTGAGTAPVPASVAEGDHVHVTMEIAGLQPDKQYAYCLVASDPSGSSSGAPVAFTTLPVAPSVGAESVSNTGIDGHIVLGAKIDPNNQETTYFFEYASEEALLGTASATKIAGESAIPAQFSEVPVSVEMNIAHPEHAYYRVIAENKTSEELYEPATGAIQSFSLPEASTGEAESITRTTVALTGTVNPRGKNATYYYEYVSETAYQAALAEHAGNPYGGGETTVPISLGASETNEPAGPIQAGGLVPETVYHYRLVAKNELGWTYGQDRTFTTAAKVLPVVSTGTASSLSQNGATLSGTVTTKGLQTEYGFEIGTEPGNYGPATGLGSIGGSLTETVSVTLGELQPATTYYYRITATNADGTVHGEPVMFATPGFPTLLTPQTELPVIPVPNIAFPTTSQENTGSTIKTKTLTNTQKLANALKACKKDKNKHKRATCEKQAHKHYGPTAKKKK